MPGQVHPTAWSLRSVKIYDQTFPGRCRTGEVTPFSSVIAEVHQAGRHGRANVRICFVGEAQQSLGGGQRALLVADLGTVGGQRAPMILRSRDLRAGHRSADLAGQRRQLRARDAVADPLGDGSPPTAS